MRATIAASEAAAYAAMAAMAATVAPASKAGAAETWAAIREAASVESWADVASYDWPAVRARVSRSAAVPARTGVMRARKRAGLIDNCCSNSHLGGGQAC